MSEQVTVEAVKDARDWESQDGSIKLTFYTLDIKKADGASEEVDHARKQGGAEPQPGEALEVVFEPGKFRRKMKKAPQGFSGGGSRESGGKSKEWQPESERDPERAARILRQHSQEMALRYYAAKGEPFNTEDIFMLADTFDQDVIEAGKQSAKQGTPEPQAGQVTSPPSASPASQNPDQELDEAAHQIGDKLADLGVISINVRDHLVKAWKELPSEKRTVAEAALVMGDGKTQSEALKRLEQIAGPLPEIPADTAGLGGADDSDIPFRRPEYTELFSERERWRF